MTSRRAECSCGRLSATCEGEPVRLALCHCLACKRRTGSAFGFSTWFNEEQVTTRGAARQFVRIGDDGGKCISNFCPDCGNTVYYTIDSIPGRIAITAGSFADMDFPPPQTSVYHDSRKYPWLDIRVVPLDTKG